MVRAPTDWGRRDPQPDITALRKFERIRQQIFQNLIQSLRVGVNRWRQLLVDVDFESEAFVFGHVSKGSDRKSTRLNSSHSQISYAVFCLKKKKKKHY